MFGFAPVSIAIGLPGSLPALLAFAAEPLAHLRALDIAVIAIYFAMVLWIGFYLKGRSNTGEEFFMAGREMTAWIAGLSFVSANLGSLELMGWAGSAYQYGILATHWYWIGAIPAMLFLGLMMMPFYYVCKTHSVPGYLEPALRRASPQRSRHRLRHRNDPHERRQHVRHGRGHEGRARLGFELLHHRLARLPSPSMSAWAACVRPSSTRCCNSCSSGAARCWSLSWASSRPAESAA